MKSKKMGILFWNIYALCYDFVAKLFPYQKLLGYLCQELNLDSGQKILDAGCGTANLELMLYQENIGKLDIEAIDASPIMLQRAKKKCGRMSGVKFSQLDLNRPLPFSNGAFDKIVCTNALYALKDPQRTIYEFSRILKLGGRIFITTMHAQPTIRAVLNAHLATILEADRPIRKVILLLQFLFLMLPISLVAVFNLIILRQGKKGQFHRFTELELKELLERSDIKVSKTALVYADTCIFAAGAKVIRHGDLVVKRVETDRELDDAYRLRYQVYCLENNSLDPSDYPDGREIDKFDDLATAVHFVALNNNEVVGTVRLCGDTEAGFLMEECFQIPKDLDRNKILEPSRLIVDKRWRKSDISLSILKAAYQYSIDNGFIYWCVASHVGFIEFLQKKGWQINILGDAVSYHNTLCAPILIMLQDESITFPY